MCLLKVLVTRSVWYGQQSAAYFIPVMGPYHGTVYRCVINSVKNDQRGLQIGKMRRFYDAFSSE